MLSKEQARAIRSAVAAEDERLPFLFHALGDGTRFRIFRLFVEHKDLCVTDVAKILGISVPAASRQLRLMELSGLVKKERLGQMICYCVRTDNPAVRTIVKMLANT